MRRSCSDSLLTASQMDRVFGSDRLHKYMMEIEHISVISDEMRTVVKEEWPELAHKLPPKPKRTTT